MLELPPWRGGCELAREGGQGWEVEASVLVQEQIIFPPPWVLGPAWGRMDLWLVVRKEPGFERWPELSSLCGTCWVSPSACVLGWHFLLLEGCCAGGISEHPPSCLVIIHNTWFLSREFLCREAHRFQISGLSAHLASVLYPDPTGFMAVWSLAVRNHCEHSVWPRLCDWQHREHPNCRFL